jgi:hypothetical protein
MVLHSWDTDYLRGWNAPGALHLVYVVGYESSTEIIDMLKNAGGVGSVVTQWAGRIAERDCPKLRNDAAAARVREWLDTMAYHHLQSLRDSAARGARGAE